MVQFGNNSLNEYNVYEDPRFTQFQTSNNAPVTKQPAPLPDLYNIPMDSYEKQGFKETLKKSDPLGTFSVMFDHPIALLGTWLAFGYGMNKYADACGGKYETSLLNKAANLGDKIYNQKWLHSSAMNSFKQTMDTGFDKVKNFLGKSDICKAFKHSPVKPEWDMVKNMMYHTDEEIVCSFSRILGELQLTNPNAKMKFNALGLKKTEIENLKKVFNVSEISRINEEKAINYTLLKRFGELSDAEILVKIESTNATAETKQYILNKLGLTTENIIAMGKNPKANLELAKSAAEKASGKVWIGAGKYKLLGPFTKPFERTITADYISNQFKSISKDLHTKGGVLSAKIVQNVYRGLTFGGGKLGALIFIIPELIHGVINTKKADKDEKVGTAVWSLGRAVSWVLTIPLSIKLLYNSLGIKFAGMSEAAIKEHENLITEFNEKLQRGEFKDKAAYKAAKKELKGKLKVLRNVKQNLFTKTLRKVVSPLSMDLHTIKPFQNSSVAGNIIRKIPNFLKNCGAVPLKFFICMMGIQGVLDSILHKGCNAVFGKDYDDEKENELKLKKEEQEKFTYEDLHQRLEKLQEKKNNESIAPDITEQNQMTKEKYEEIRNLQKNKMQERMKIQNQPQKTIVNTNMTETIPVNTQHNTAKNLQNIETENNQTVSEEINPQAEVVAEQKHDNYTYIPSQNSVLQKKQETSVEKYIPSQKPAKIVVQNDNSAINDVLAKADIAEQRAMEILSGKFENM